jgi:hypothetical protein
MIGPTLGTGHRHEHSPDGDAPIARCLVDMAFMLPTTSVTSSLANGSELAVAHRGAVDEETMMRATTAFQATTTGTSSASTTTPVRSRAPYFSYGRALCAQWDQTAFEPGYDTLPLE